MARKKKQDLVTYQIDGSRLSLSEEKHLGDMIEFMKENLKEGKFKKDGNTVKISVPENITQRMIKRRADKYLYQSGLKMEYRLVSLQNKGIQGYSIMNR